MPPRLTPLRLELLRRLARLMADLGRPPSSAELAQAAGLSPSALSFHLKALLALGYVQRPTPRAALQLTAKAGGAVGRGIPVYGQIAAGPPLLAEQGHERVSSLEEFLGAQDGDFLLRVRGQSMTGLGILDGDYVLVRPCAEVHDGEVAVVLLPRENEATLKRIYHFGDDVVLVSENPDVPRMIYPAQDVAVQGRLIARLGLSVPRVSRRS